MELKKGNQTLEIKKSSYIFFNLNFLHQASLLNFDSVEAFTPKERLNHSNKIDHLFIKKLKLAKKEAIQ